MLALYIFKKILKIFLRISSNITLVSLCRQNMGLGLRAEGSVVLPGRAWCRFPFGLLLGSAWLVFGVKQPKMEDEKAGVWKKKEGKEEGGMRDREVWELQLVVTAYKTCCRGRSIRRHSTAMVASGPMDILSILSVSSHTIWEQQEQRAFSRGNH